MKTKFFIFDQINSGGSFDVDENVCACVIIEAKNATAARRIFAPMIEDQSPSCSCCGDRWSTRSPQSIEDILLEYKESGYPAYESYPLVTPEVEEANWFKIYGHLPRITEPTWCRYLGHKHFFGKVYFDSIEQYCQFLADQDATSSARTVPDVRIHYLDGTKKEFIGTIK